MNPTSCIRLILIFIVSVYSIDMNTKALNYTHCTPGRNCLQCLNQYICSKCAPLEKCCPKRCISCTNDTTCFQCEPGFDITSHQQKGWTFCTNSNKYTHIDYHRIKIPNQNTYNTPSVSTLCEEGYYYESNIKFCEKCLVRNCSICHDSIHCFICESGFLLFNGLCLTIEDIKTAFGPVYTPQSEEQNRQFVLFVIIVGIVIGCCFSCTFVILFSCIKGCCRRCFNKYFPSDDSQILTEEQITKQPNPERKQNGSKQNKMRQNSQRFSSQCIYNAAMTEQNIIK